MAIADDLTAILEIKQNIKTSLANKGLTPTDNFFTYADLINNISPGLTIGEQKTCNISYNFQSTLMGSSITLPNTEPDSAQVSYTIQPGYFPTLSGDFIAEVSYLGFILAGCANTNGSSARTLNWRIKRNGVNIANGAQSINANNKAVLNASCLVDTNSPNIGDVIEIFLWCAESAMDLQLNRHSLGIVPTRVKPVNNHNKLLYQTGITVNYYTTVLNFTLNASAYNRQGVIRTDNNDSLLVLSANTTYTFNFKNEHQTYGIYAVQSDSTASNFVRQHASNYLYEPHEVITQVQWKETNISYSGQ